MSIMNSWGSVPRNSSTGAPSLVDCTWAITEAVKALSGPDEDGVYPPEGDQRPYSLYQTGRVLRGRYTSPPAGRLPFAAVSAASTRSQQGQSLSSWLTDCTVDIVAWFPARSADVDTRVQDGELLAGWLTALLQTASRTPSNPLYKVRGFTVESGSLDSDADPVPPRQIVVVLTVTFSMQRNPPNYGLSDVTGVPGEDP